MSNFTIKIDQNPYLPEGGREVHAVVTVESTGGGVTAVAPEAGEVIIIDNSGSMGAPAAKIQSAKRAAATAVDHIRDGVYFAVVVGSNNAQMVYPRQGMMPANPQTRAEAKGAIGQVQAYGGTAMGTWIALADQLFNSQFGTRTDVIRHAILLTDGKNQHESPQQLDATLANCGGRFVCDTRGVGTDWDPTELRRIASAMLGSILDIPNPQDLESDFKQMTQQAMGKAVADVALRVWTPQDAKIRFVKQVAPDILDLTGRRADAGPQAGDYPTGSWGKESRDYHVCVEVPPGAIGREMRAAWIKLVVPGTEEVLGSGNVLAEWTDDEAMSTQINKRVAAVTGQEELADAIQEGLAARRDGDTETATARLGRAAQLARESGDSEKVALLGKVVDFDEGTGTARLKRSVDKADEISLDTRSTKTARTRPGQA